MGTLDEAIRKTLGAVETIAPKAWEMAVRYERVDALSSLMTQALFVLALPFMARWLWRHRPEKQKYELGYEFTSFVAGGMTLAAFIVAFCIPSNIIRYVNAEVYAARAIIERVGK